MSFTVLAPPPIRWGPPLCAGREGRPGTVDDEGTWTNGKLGERANLFRRHIVSHPVLATLAMEQPLDDPTRRPIRQPISDTAGSGDPEHGPIDVPLGDPISIGGDLDALFREHYARLVRALTLSCGDREQAADAVQEAFVKAHLRWRRLQHYDDPVGWIRRVAINGLRDGHRRSGRKRAVMQRLEGDATRHEHSGADATHEAMSRRTGDTDGVMAVLQTLPRQQRVCIALFHVDGLAIAEIADALGISDGAVKFHLHQGRERLRGALALRTERTEESAQPSTTSATSRMPGRPIDEGFRS